MATRKLKNGGRKKAFFGAEAGAILAAAGINVAGTLAASAIGANATKKAAQEQARATVQSANEQARAIKDQSSKAKEIQERSQEFMKEENAENRELQKDIQLQLQMLTGQQNVNDRLEASKIQVKNGGSARRKLRLAGKSSFPLQGNDNIPFVVTDGGSVLPVGVTPEGYELYEIVGNDHKHYHKTRGGKNKTGVGIKFADGNVIEGEGNQNSSHGEYLLSTPTDALFISKHSISGFNPADMVDNGMHPMEAYLIQENLKQAKGISDDGKQDRTLVKKMMGGFQNPLVVMANENGPQTGVDTIGDTAVGIAYENNNNMLRRTLKCGGKKRGRAPYGKRWNWNSGAFENGIDPIKLAGYVELPETISVPNGVVPSNTQPRNRIGFLSNLSNVDKANLFGAGLNAVGNLGGTLIATGANRSAARSLARAYGQAAGIVRDAYNSLKGVDINSIRREDFSAAHAMPALQAPVSQAASRISGVDRQLHRRLSNAGRYSASSAAAQKRMNDIEVSTQDMRNQIYSDDQQLMQQIRQANAERVTQAAMKNAELDTAANQQYAGAYLDMLKYNNDIYNQKILGAAGAISEGAINGATALADARTSNGALWSKALVGSTQGFSNSLSAMATRKADLEKVLLGAGSDSQATYYSNPRLASRSEAEQQYNSLMTQLTALEASNKPEDSETIKQIKRRINTIAAGRGFAMV